MSQGKTIFFPYKHKWLADIIKEDTPEHARESVRELKKIFERSNRTKRRLILQAANLAANRAKVMANRHKKPGEKGYISPKEREEFREIEKIYRNFVEWCSRRLR